ncbi:hypothetical protein E1J25_14470 [Xanthomonas hortorum pv. taraxaci]|nr:hypothetical protein [Xanthomonas hortorum pv. taraxaci]
MPRKSLHGRTCGVSREGGRARALQPCPGSTALQVIHPHDAITPTKQPISKVLASSRCKG